MLAFVFQSHFLNIRKKINQLLPEKSRRKYCGVFAFFPILTSSIWTATNLPPLCKIHMGASQLRNFPMPCIPLPFLVKIKVCLISFLFERPDSHEKAGINA